MNTVSHGEEFLKQDTITFLVPNKWLITYAVAVPSPILAVTPLSATQVSTAVQKSVI
jgi:hypothetical protein